MLEFLEKSFLFLFFFSVGGVAGREGGRVKGRISALWVNNET